MCFVFFPSGQSSSQEGRPLCTRKMPPGSTRPSSPWGSPCWGFVTGCRFVCVHVHKNEPRRLSSPHEPLMSVLTLPRSFCVADDEQGVRRHGAQKEREGRRRVQRRAGQHVLPLQVGASARNILLHKLWTRLYDQRCESHFGSSIGLMSCGRWLLFHVVDDAGSGGKGSSQVGELQGCDDIQISLYSSTSIPLISA